MAGSYVSAALRREVIQRAGGRCEYCRFPAELTLFSFEVEHIVAEKHGGATSATNLALACPFCNRAKGTDLASLDPLTGDLTPFYNPRSSPGTITFSSMGQRSCRCQPSDGSQSPFCR